MDHVQLYISWLNKVDVLTSCIPFSHEMTPTVKTNLIVGYFFSITHTFDKRKEYLWIFFIWANMNYVQLYISWLNKVVLLKSPGGVDFALVTILDASVYWNETRQLQYFR